MKLNLRALALAFACLGVAAAASAQDTEAPPPDPGRFRFGPIRFTPSIELTSVGRDSNVFNEADNARGDTTAAFGPTVQLWMNPGSTRLTGKFSGQYLYFKEYATHRASNSSYFEKFKYDESLI
jgi:hypothetical protein